MGLSRPILEKTTLWLSSSSFEEGKRRLWQPWPPPLQLGPSILRRSRGEPLRERPTLSYTGLRLWLPSLLEAKHGHRPLVSWRDQLTAKPIAEPQGWPATKPVGLPAGLWLLGWAPGGTQGQGGQKPGRGWPWLSPSEMVVTITTLSHGRDPWLGLKADTHSCTLMSLWSYHYIVDFCLGVGHLLRCPTPRKL